MKQILPFTIHAAILSIGILAFFMFLFLAQGILVPLVFSFVLAILLNPMVLFFQHRKMGRILSISLTIVIILLVILVLVFFLFSQASKFIDSFPKVLESFNGILVQTEKWLSDHYNVNPIKLEVWLQEGNKELLSASRGMIGSTLINFGSLLVILVLIPVYVWMILFYQPLFTEFIYRLFEHREKKEIKEVLLKVKSLIQGYLIGLLLEALIVAILNVSGLLLLGIDYAVLLGIIGALLNFIPYIGGIIAVALPMLIAIATKSPTSALLVLALYTLIQFIDNNFIMTKIVASKVKINGLASVVVVITGGALWGISGMFLSLPICAVLKVLLDHSESLRAWGFVLGDEIL